MYQEITTFICDIVVNEINVLKLSAALTIPKQKFYSLRSKIWFGR